MDAQKKSCLYLERCEHERCAFLEVLKGIPQEQRVYVDEAGVDDTVSYVYGWSRKGTRCHGERLGHRTKRVSMAAAWCQSPCGQSRVISPLTFEGYCNAALVEAWFSQHLIKALQPGQVVILDNASFHSMKRLGAILEKVGCFLLPLPRYSPDLNKIEHLWNTLKVRIAHSKHRYTNFRDAVDAAFV